MAVNLGQEPLTVNPEQYMQFKPTSWTRASEATAQKLKNVGARGIGLVPEVQKETSGAGLAIAAGAVALAFMVGG